MPSSEVTERAPQNSSSPAQIKTKYSLNKSQLKSINPGKRRDSLEDCMIGTMIETGLPSSLNKFIQFLRENFLTEKNPQFHQEKKFSLNNNNPQNRSLQFVMTKNQCTELATKLKDSKKNQKTLLTLESPPSGFSIEVNFIKGKDGLLRIAEPSIISSNAQNPVSNYIPPKKNKKCSEENKLKITERQVDTTKTKNAVNPLSVEVPTYAGDSNYPTDLDVDLRQPSPFENLHSLEDAGNFSQTATQSEKSYPQLAIFRPAPRTNPHTNVKTVVGVGLAVGVCVGLGMVAAAAATVVSASFLFLLTVGLFGAFIGTAVGAGLAAALSSQEQDHNTPSCTI